jgi:soluble lytic murein transglycosylase-like protein
MRLKHAILALAASCGALLATPYGARADNIVLKNGQRLNVTGYQLINGIYHLQMNGGFVDVPFDEVAAIEPEDQFAAPPPPAPLLSMKNHYRDLVETSAARYQVDADLISSVIATESNFNARAVSHKNARGLMQLMPETAAKLGVRNVFDPQENIDAGTRYLGNLLQRYRNDLSLALAAYNAGPERVEQYGRVPPFAETVSYVRKVQRTYQNSKSAQPGKNSSVPEAASFITNSVASSPGVTTGTSSATSSGNSPGTSSGTSLPANASAAQPAPALQP